jgi:integrase
MIYKREKSRCWHYDFAVAGERYRGSTKEATKAAALQYEATLRAKIAEVGPSILPKKAPVLREFSPRFRTFIEQHNRLAPKSKAYYEDGIDLLLRTSLISKRLNNITGTDIETLQLPGSASRQNCALRTLRRMLHLAKKWKLLRDTPRIPLFEQRQRRDVFDPSVEQKITNEARQPLQDIFVTMMDSGGRPDEITRLRWDDIFWDYSVIFIRKGKTKKSIRYVPLSNRVRDRLRERFEAAEDKSGFVFLSNRTRNGHVSISSLDKEFRRVRGVLGLSEDLVLYVARHSFATSLLGETGNIQLVADTLGHADTKITSTYLHPATSRMSEIINQRNERRSHEFTSHSTSHRGSRGSSGVPDRTRAMLSQVAVPRQLRT